MFALASLNFAGAQTEAVIHSFRYASAFDGIEPLGGVFVAANGALYGTASGGGKYGYGAIYKLAPPSTQGGEWRQSVLYSFMGSFNGASDGSSPTGNIVVTKGGNVYGTTQGGGQYGEGTAYELSPPVESGSPWTETVLCSFNGSSAPSGLVAGAGGRFFGATSLGGVHGVGTVFAVSPPPEGGGTWAVDTLYNFDGKGGGSQAYPSGVVVDSSGALYGTADSVDTANGGVVFKLSPPSDGKGAWTESILHSFTGGADDGFAPSGGLVFDSAGALYGNTLGGGQFGSGAVYRVSPPAVQGGRWTEALLYSFDGIETGLAPVAALAFDSVGALYGVTQYGGIESCGDADAGCGTVFKLDPPTIQGGSWAGSLLYSFEGGSDGDFPQAPVAVVGTDVYGTTALGGTGYCNGPAGQLGCGTVFQIAQ